jgi:hypothetical protein
MIVDSGDAITAAETAYAALTADQKALVTNYAVLTAAREAYDALIPPAVEYGDVDGSGVIDTDDISVLSVYLANYDDTTGTSTVTVAAGADVDGSGVIDTDDISLLSVYLANYDDTTGTSTVELGPQG